MQEQVRLCLRGLALGIGAHEEGWTVVLGNCVALQDQRWVWAPSDSARERLPGEGYGGMFEIAETRIDPAFTFTASTATENDAFDVLYRYDYLARPAKAGSFNGSPRNAKEVSADFKTFTVKVRPVHLLWQTTPLWRRRLSSLSPRFCIHLQAHFRS